MAFGLETWKQSLGAQLNGWWSRAQQAGVESPYAALAAAALGPVLQAARSGDLGGALVTLGSLASGGGVTVIANQVHAWKEQVRPVEEADVASWVQTEAARDQGLRDALDGILVKLDAVARAQVALDTGERQAFQLALRADLDRLGNLPRFRAKLRGSGAIAQAKGRAVAAGKRGVAIGGMSGTVSSRRRSSRATSTWGNPLVAAPRP